MEYGVAAVDKAVASKVDGLIMASRRRDERMHDIRLARAGDLDELAPGLFASNWPRPVVANFIDVAARDLASVLAPLPSLNCASGKMQSDADRRRAEKKNKIGQDYWSESRLSTQMFTGADRWSSYGFLPFYVEPDFDRARPIIQVEDPYGAYYETDRWGCTTTYVRRWDCTIAELCALWPEYEGRIRGSIRNDYDSQAKIKVIRYCDEYKTILYLPERDNLVLTQYRNPIDSCPAVVIERPKLDNENRGQYDGVIWVQLALHRMGMLAMDGAYRAVMAPMAMPNDAQELPLGPDAVIRSDNPDGIRRVPLELPQSAFSWSAQLEDQLRTGAGYPEARTGQSPGSVVTGRGVEALMGSFDTQIKTFQELARWGLTQTTSKCFEMDEKLFGGRDRTVNGTLHGESYQITVNPGKDIDGNYSCDVTYGFAAGLSPNQAIVLLLQARGDGLISRNTVRRQMPFDIDVDQEQRDLDVQEGEDALKQGLYSFAQALAPMAAQGMDPTVPIRALASVIQARAKGTPLAQAVTEAFAPPDAAPGAPGAPPGPEDPAAAGAAGPGGSLPGIGPSGLPAGVAPGQAAQGPGGLPSVQDIIAGLSSSGQPNLQASVRRRTPAG
jgi:hypothetical protein